MGEALQTGASKNFHGREEERSLLGVIDIALLIIADRGSKNTIRA